MSGKGGVGKTTLAVFLSTYYARKANNVILADLDVEEPNAGIFFKKQKFILSTRLCIDLDGKKIYASSAESAKNIANSMLLRHCPIMSLSFKNSAIVVMPVQNSVQQKPCRCIRQK